MLDVLIVGAGPAGSVAGAILARAGVRVRIVDRARFPRPKLCGDTVNPGTLARLQALALADGIDERSLRVHGMRVTGERGVDIEGRYPGGLTGRAITRRDLDWLLVQQAIAAGCRFEPAVIVRRAFVDEQGARRSVRGAVIAAGGHESTLEAAVTIAADGRHSTIAFGLGLARHPPRPQRWAVGAYFENFTPMEVGPRPGVDPAASGRPAGDGPVVSTCGEMHVRRQYYIGVAPIPGGLTNVCLVRPSGRGDRDFRDPATLLTHALASDPLLRDRAANARLTASPSVIGPLAVDVRDTAIDGLLLAGDAAGFIDPMTGDGLRFAADGGVLAAAAAVEALAHGWAGVHARLAAARRRAFGSKWRFNRALRALVASPYAVDMAALAARIAPGALQTVIARAGDCQAAGL